jgi:hypothetical protein
MTTRTPSHPATGSDDGLAQSTTACTGLGMISPVPPGIHPGDTAALEVLTQLGQAPIDHYAAMRAATGRRCASRTRRRIAGRGASCRVFSAYDLPHGNAVGHHRGRPQRHDAVIAERSLTGRSGRPALRSLSRSPDEEKHPCLS